MTLTFIFNLAGRGGGGGVFLMVTGICFAISLLFLTRFGATLGVNLEEIFTLRVVELLSV